MWQIRKGTNSDFEQVTSLLLQLWPSKKQDPLRLKGAYERGLASSNQRYFVAVDNGLIVGFVSLSFKNSLWQEGLLANIDEMVVDDEARGQGIGKALVEYAIDLARKSGCTRIELDSAFYRTESHAFYEHLGFEQRAYLYTMAI